MRHQGLSTCYIKWDTHRHCTITLLAGFRHTCSHFIHLNLLFLPTLPLFLQPALLPHSLFACVYLSPSVSPSKFSVFLPIITSHLWGPLLRRALHLSPRCDNRYRWHSLLGLSPINTCSALSLFLSFLFSNPPPSHLCLLPLSPSVKSLVFMAWLFVFSPITQFPHFTISLTFGGHSVLQSIAAT